MADTVVNTKTSLPADEVVVRAIQFFSNEKWQVTSQSGRAVTFHGRPPIPVFLILLTIIGYMACIIPGIILWMVVVKKLRKFQNLIVTASPLSEGSDVSVSHPAHAKKIVKRFLVALPVAPSP